jgi:hypothetical protein
MRVASQPASAAGLQRGSGKSLLYQLLSCLPPAFVMVGVELAVSSKGSADLTAVAVVLVHGDGGAS